MMLDEMAVVLAKIQLGDNRHVDRLVLDYWLDTIGDLTQQQALDALKRFRRERPGVYLEPGHLLELAEVTAPDPHVEDVTPQYLEAAKARDLAAIGVTVEAYDNDPAVQAAADVKLDALAIDRLVTE